MDEMSRKKLCLMLALEHQVDDTRVSKMARSLCGKYDVGIVAKSVRGGVPLPSERQLGLHADDRKLRKCFHALELVKRLRPDVIHCHDLTSLAVGMFAKLFYGGKLVFDVHECYEKARCNWWRLEGIFASAVVSLLLPLFGRLIDGFVFVVPEQEAVYARFDKPAAVLPNLPSLRDFEDATCGHGRNEKDFLLIYEGGISRERGLFEYLSMINTIRAELPQAKLVLAGWFNSKDTEAEARACIRTNGLTENVVILGKVPRHELYNYISASRIGLFFVVDSYYNPPAFGFPNKIFDYMACGVPVVYSENLSKMQEFVADEGCGLAVAYGDTDGAVAAIRRILADYDRFSDNCLRATRLHNWQKQEGKLIQLYETVLGV